MIWQIIGAYIATVAGSIFLEAPKKFIFYTGLIGAIGWGVYLNLIDIYGLVVSMYAAALIISALSHISSRIFKIPVTIFFLPGVLPLVPGLSIYRAVYSFISGSSQLGQVYLEEVIKISAMLALAIFTMDTIFKTIIKIQNVYKKSIKQAS